jgi:hypothetical protein
MAGVGEREAWILQSVAAAPGRGEVLHTRDGGEHFQTLSFEGPATSFKVLYADAQSLIFAGADVRETTPRYSIYRATPDAPTARAIYVAPPAGPWNESVAVFADAKTGWVLEDGSAVTRTRDGGATWERTYTLPEATQPNDVTRWALSLDGPRPELTQRANGALLARLLSNDEGKTFERYAQLCGPEDRFTDGAIVFCIDRSGETERLRRSGDGGKTFADVELPLAKARPGEPRTQLAGPVAKRSIAKGAPDALVLGALDGERVQHVASEDQGRTWKLVVLPAAPPETKPESAAQRPDALDATWHAVGMWWQPNRVVWGALWSTSEGVCAARSTDGGATWHALRRGPRAGSPGVAAAASAGAGTAR